MGFSDVLTIQFGTVTDGSGGVPMAAIIIVGIVCLIVGFVLGMKLPSKLGIGGNGKPQMSSQDVFRQMNGMSPAYNQPQGGNRPQQQRRPQGNNGYPQQNGIRPQQQPDLWGNNTQQGRPQQRPQQGNMQQRRPQQRPMQQPQQNMDFEQQMSGRGWDDNNF